MVSNRMLYKFCKQFVDEYENEKENIDYDELYEYGMTEDEYLEQCCGMIKAGIQALITDDFVKMLDQPLQEEIVLNCMRIKVGK